MELTVIITKTGCNEAFIATNPKTLFPFWSPYNECLQLQCNVQLTFDWFVVLFFIFLSFSFFCFCLYAAYQLLHNYR